MRQRFVDLRVARLVDERRQVASSGWTVIKPLLCLENRKTAEGIELGRNSRLLVGWTVNLKAGQACIYPIERSAAAQITTKADIYDTQQR